MRLFEKFNLREPVFLKRDSTAQKELVLLQTRLSGASGEEKVKIERKMKAVSKGIAGEDNIAYELSNSHMPLYILHDLYLAHEGLTAQIDYLLITRKKFFILECKNLYGDIEINEQGDFIRHIHYGGTYRRERIYSPVTQNARHMELIRAMRLGQGRGIFSKSYFDRNFYEIYQSFIVLSNSKSVRRDRSAPPEIRRQVIYADQLIDSIRAANAQRREPERSDEEMQSLAELFLSAHQNVEPHISLDNAQDDDCEAVTASMPPAAPAPFAAGMYTAPLYTASVTPAAQGKADDQMICPRCGAPMKRRTAKKGTNAGKEFWGCSRYPQCKGIVDIQSPQAQA